MAQDEVAPLEEDDFDVGISFTDNIEVKPGLTVSVAKNSNPFYRGERDEESGYVFHVDPSLRLTLPVNELFFIGLYAKLNYTTVALDSESDVAEDRDVLQPHLTAKLRYNFSDHSSLSVSDSYQEANVSDQIDGPKYDLNEMTLSFHQEIGDGLAGKIWYRNRTLAQDGNSLLFDFDDNTLGAGVQYVLTRTDSGRDVTVMISGSFADREFEDAESLGLSGTNPKTHTSQSVGVSLGLPLGAGLSASLGTGFVKRDYDDETFGASSESDSVHGAAAVTLVPVRNTSFTVAAAYEVSDTLVFNTSSAQAEVFDAVDPLLSNLNTLFREQDIMRFGFRAEHTLSERVAAGLAFVYQHAEADADENLITSNYSGQSNVDFDDLDEDRYTVGGRLSYHLLENLDVGVAYEYGIAEDTTGDLYEFDAAAFTARVYF